MSARTILRLGIMSALLTLLSIKGVGEECVNDRLRISVASVAGGGSISLEMGNDAEQPLRVFESTNGWGANRYRVVIIRKERVYKFFEASHQTYFYDLPSFVEVAPRSQMTRLLDINDGNWKGNRNRRFALYSGDRIVGLYDVPFSQAGQQFKVWCGVAAGSAVVR